MRVIMKTLSHCRYELQMLAGSYGKSTRAAAEYMVPWKHVDNEGEELCHDANLPPEVDLPVEGTEPQSSPSGMSRHSKLNTSSANEKNFLPLVLILRFGRQES
ncbi:hypothetical protein KGM_213862 [Danaus plexippus plexippus]|uniref:Uncharacterized protein n=1 Tax=Danaus plexippus plexippus TaxID=278856 RepID=A0A212EHP8_DANPL|nr:hypothetical protein KGM_213862 [Danaus plexippus plexippus]